MDDARVGIYVHVPFCERVCPYCDFAVEKTASLSRAVEDAYVDALLAELSQRRGRFAGRALATVYLGGGTPSLLRPQSIERIVAGVHAAFPSAPGEAVETTLELNPGTTERARLPAFRASGVDRLSVGVQSFDDRTLKRLGRAHRARDCCAALEAARAAGFENVSLDLILAAPGQRLAGVERDLAAALDFEPRHVSVYLLAVEPGTPFARAARGQLDLAGDDEAAQMLERAGERLAEAGLERYEISSFARPCFESRHNRRYWQRRAVLGLGAGAWSCDPADEGAPHGARRGNVRSRAEYLARIEAGASAAAGPDEPLEGPAARGEAAFLALRTREGLSAADFAGEFGAPPRGFFAAAIDELVVADLLDESADGSLRLTRRGILLSDSVFERFV